MAAHPGAGASFKIGGPGETPAGGALTEVAVWCDDITADTDQDELDGTTFSPGATTPVKYTLFGSISRSHTFTGKWVVAAETFFNSIEGMQNRTYEYGPLGTTAGAPKISGTLNVGAWSGPQQGVGGVITFSITCSVNSRTVGTFV